MITFAFATLEHAPVGSVSCNTLPSGNMIIHYFITLKCIVTLLLGSISFTNIVAQPDLQGGWQGTLGSDASCGIDVDTFPYGDLTITF